MERDICVFDYLKIVLLCSVNFDMVYREYVFILESLRKLIWRVIEGGLFLVFKIIL